MEEPIFTKRWWKYIVVFFVIWYPISVILFTAYQLTASPIAFIANNILMPVLLFMFAYGYFKKSRNDWVARFSTAFGWLALTFLFATLLVKPVYGYEWSSILNIPVILSSWINIVAVLVAGMAVPRRGSQKLRQVTDQPK